MPWCPYSRRPIDLLVGEYDRGKAIALVEYKHELATDPNLRHPSYRALVDLADRAALPAFLCRYAGDFSRWWVYPLNVVARVHLPLSRQLSEAEWVNFLYHPRGRVMAN